jgi:hypothetical protein
MRVNSKNGKGSNTSANFPWFTYPPLEKDAGGWGRYKISSYLEGQKD